MARVVAALPYYCSHEQVTVRKEHGNLRGQRVLCPPVRSRDPAHASSICIGDGRPRSSAWPATRRRAISGSIFRRTPRFGIDHLRKWFGDRVFETKARGFKAVIDERIVERPFGNVARDRLNPRGLPDAVPLRGDGTLAGSVKALLVAMLDADKPPTMRRVVAAAGTSARTFQRLLDAEGTNFSDLLAEVRRSETLRRLNERNSSIAAIAADLGYSDQASFTRAFRRWTGSPPSQFRSRIA